MLVIMIQLVHEICFSMPPKVLQKEKKVEKLNQLKKWGEENDV